MISEREMDAPRERRFTLGEYRVGINFNPGGNPLVDDIKRRAADFIDLIDNMILPGTYDSASAGEVRRLQAHAMTLVEDAAMNAVKAATKPPRG